ncbi:MAG: OmpH family outer membrane protein [Smithella sp.]
MKRKNYLIAVIVLLIFAWSASSPAADKIGFIDMQEIMFNSVIGKKAMDDFQQTYKKKKEEIKSAEAEIKKMRDELDKQSELMTPNSRDEKESAYEKKVRDYKFLVQDADDEMQKRDQEMSQKLTMEIIKIVRAIAKKEKYALVIDVANMPVTYYDKEHDFSKKVIEEYNKMK